MTHAKPKITVTGPESSGTSMVKRIFEQAGAEVFHRSATYAVRYPDLLDLACDCDVVVCVFRDPCATVASQKAQGFGNAWAKLQAGYREVFRALAATPNPVYVVTYEQIVARRDSLDPLLERFGLDPGAVTEEVRDESAKYHAGASAQP